MHFLWLDHILNMPGSIFSVQGVIGSFSSVLQVEILASEARKLTLFFAKKAIFFHLLLSVAFFGVGSLKVMCLEFNFGHQV